MLFACYHVMLPYKYTLNDTQNQFITLAWLQSAITIYIAYAYAIVIALACNQHQLYTNRLTL